VRNNSWISNSSRIAILKFGLVSAVTAATAIFCIATYKLASWRAPGARGVEDTSRSPPNRRGDGTRIPSKSSASSYPASISSLPPTVDILSALPDELLEHIFLYLTFPEDESRAVDSDNLSSLCLVSRRFTYIAQSLLHSTVEIDDAVDNTLLLRTFKSRLDLQHSVRSLKLKMVCRSNSCTKLSDVLRTLYPVAPLDQIFDFFKPLQAWSGPGEKVSLTPESSLVVLFPRLRSVSVDVTEHHTLDMLHHIFAHPNVEELTFDPFKLDPMSSSIELATQFLETSLRRLHLHQMYPHVHNQQILRLFQPIAVAMPNLEVLDIHMPQYTSNISRYLLCFFVTQLQGPKLKRLSMHDKQCRDTADIFLFTEGSAEDRDALVPLRYSQLEYLQTDLFLLINNFRDLNTLDTAADLPLPSALKRLDIRYSETQDGLFTKLYHWDGRSVALHIRAKFPDLQRITLRLNTQHDYNLLLKKLLKHIKAQGIYFEVIYTPAEVSFFPG
jgi:hypothetical protein